MYRSLLLMCTILVSSVAAAQDWVGNWLNYVSKTQAEQPHWVTPLATVTPRLEQELRFDTFRQIPASGDPLWNIDGGKGLELIPEKHIELLFNLPPYLKHIDPRLIDGWGDVSMVMKYRVAAGNEEHGNYIVTLFLGGSIPTGTYKNGSAAAVVTPTIAAGKGWRKFDVQSTLGAGLPVTNADTIGHALAWNNAFQYHVTRFLWPEVELNSTFFKGGTNDGKKQVFLTPGVVFGRFLLHHRLGLTLGAGMQIAATHFHTYNHGLILTARLPF